MGLGPIFSQREKKKGKRKEGWRGKNVEGGKRSNGGFKQELKQAACSISEEKKES